MLDIQKNLEGNTELHLDVAIIGVCHHAGILVLIEGHSPEVMDVEAEHNHLERISLPSAGLAPGVEHVAAVVKATQMGLGCCFLLQYLIQSCAWGEEDSGEYVL
jgi:hypothetical protein